MEKTEQLLLPFDLRPALSPESFYRSTSNAVAFSWIQRWPHWPHRTLTIYGPSGCGKTHLGHVWQHCTQASWLTREEQKHATPFSLTAKNPFWILDNVPHIENELFLLQFYNLIQENGGGLLLLAPVPPIRWPFQLADLRSRLHMIPAIEIGQPDDALLKRILLKLFQDQQVRVSEEVIDFLLRHMERSFASAQRLVQGINDKSLRLGRPITIPLIRELV